MLIGAHILLYSEKPELDRAFFRDILELRSVDAGGGWLIFALPASEAALHPTDGDRSQVHGGRELLRAVLYLMCTDLRAYIAGLERKGVRCTEVSEEPWGLKTTIPLPSGREIVLYQPMHPTALNLAPA